VVTDPRTDAQAIKEASYVNIPVIALCDTDSPTDYVDVAIPTNNKGRHAIGCVWWMLAREVLRLRGTIYNRETPWDVMVDLYFCMCFRILNLLCSSSTNHSQTATPRLRPRRRLRRRSSPALRRRVLPPSSPASPLVVSGRLLLPPLPLVSGARLPLPTGMPLALLPPLSGVLRPPRMLPTGKQKIKKAFLVLA